VTVVERGTGRIVTSVAELRALADDIRAKGGTVGFLGTSGNLHRGHLTLIRRMVEECDLAVIPLYKDAMYSVPGLVEFGPDAGYERDGDADRALAIEVGVDVVFMPERSEMYPRLPVQIHVTPSDELASPWENAENPAFIRMTATAVTKYWNILAPCRYYLGEKDWVPLTMLRRVIDDLSVRVELVACPIVRMDDGVCASSRNAKLSPEDRAAAPVLYQTLQEAIALVESGERNGQAVRDLLRGRIEPVAPVDYAEIVHAFTLNRVDPLQGEMRIVVSANFSGVHLFDNIGVVVPATPG
jgi:pantoate--beta-alanine ligase